MKLALAMVLALLLAICGRNSERVFKQRRRLSGWRPIARVYQQSSEADGRTRGRISAAYAANGSLSLLERGQVTFYVRTGGGVFTATASENDLRSH